MAQTILVIGSFMLLSILTASVNNAIINKTVDSYQTEAVISATTRAQALMQEVMAKEFDQNTVSGAVDTTIKLTAVSKMGKETGEVYPSFNDLDDFKYYTKTDSGFKSTVDVQYLNPATLTASKMDTSTVQTYYKRITVTVFDPKEMLFPVQLVNIISY